MKTISLRGLSRDAPDLTEEVLVTHDSVVIGRFVPATIIASRPYVQQTAEHHPIDAPRPPETQWQASEIKATVTTPATNSPTTTSSISPIDQTHSFGQSRPAPKPTKGAKR